MSDAPMRQEGDVVPARTILAILAGTLIVTVVGGMSAYLIGDCRAGALGHDIRVPPLPEVPPVVETMETTLFGQPARGVQQHREADRRLSAFGWVDRDRGVVHVPIEAAMELVVERLAEEDER